MDRFMYLMIMRMLAMTLKKQFSVVTFSNFELEIGEIIHIQMR